MTRPIATWTVRAILVALLVGVYLGSRVALVLLLARALLACDWCVQQLEQRDDDTFAEHVRRL